MQTAEPAEQRRANKNSACAAVSAVKSESDVAYFFAAAAGFAADGPLHVQPWISQPEGPIFIANVMCALSRLDTRPCLNE